MCISIYTDRVQVVQNGQYYHLIYVLVPHLFTRLPKNIILKVGIFSIIISF